MIKIAIVEDHTLFREGIKSLLAKISDFKIVAEFINGKEYIDNIFNMEVDIVLMDVEMPEMNGVEAARLSNIKKPEIHVIALSMYSEQKYYYEMIRSGISGFVLKEASPEELEKAIRDVYTGLGFFSPKLLQKAILNFSEQDKSKKNIDKLSFTDRESEILELICKGLSNNEISEQLFLSPRTVESHKAKIMKKTNTKNTAGLIIFAIKNEIVEI